MRARYGGLAIIPLAGHMIDALAGIHGDIALDGAARAGEGGLEAVQRRMARRCAKACQAQHNSPAERALDA